jgi:FixJ family two-component response regulator
MIAIIDDDESVRLALQSCIESHEMAATTYASAEAFLADYPQPGLSCIVTDMQMPGMGGLALLAVLTRMKCRVAIVLITAYADDTIRRIALSNGAAAFFTKPFSTAELMACIHALTAE